MKQLKIVNVELGEPSLGRGENLCVTLERSDGKRFAVNIPECEWSEEKEIIPHGLNLVFGEGCHYY
jgi:hypothetical protein